MKIYYSIFRFNPLKKLVFIVLLISCQAADRDEQEGVLRPATPESQGVASEAILDFIDAAETQLPEALHSLVILRHGRKIAEGWWKPYDAETPHWLYSLSKSFTSTAIGLAIDGGLLSIDDPVVSFFPEKIPDEVSTNLGNMRIRDLLRMNTGQIIDGSGEFRRVSEDWVRSFLSLPVDFKPGTKFTYNSGASYMLSAIIQKKTGQNLVEFLQPRVFDPLEIEKPEWLTDPDGINTGGWGLRLKTEDIARLGQLYLQEGEWNGKQIISKEWVHMATSYQTSNGSNPESDWDQGYGFQFWMCRNNAYRGDGAFGQFCIVLPEQEAVIAITSGTTDMQSVLNLVWDYLLPGMKEQPLPEDPEVNRKLEKRLNSLSLTMVDGSKKEELASEISGKVYVLDTNHLHFEEITLELSGDTHNMEFSNPGGRFNIPIGFQEALEGELGLYFYNRFEILKTAASGAWISEDTYRLRVWYYESPHSITYDFHFSGNDLRVEADYGAPLGSPDTFTLIGKLKNAGIDG